MFAMFIYICFGFGLAISLWLPDFNGQFIIYENNSLPIILPQNMLYND